MLGPSREPEKYNGRSLEDDVSMVSPFPSTAVSNSRNVQSENEKDTSQLESLKRSVDHKTSANNVSELATKHN
ncbi:hypothetical protein ACET3Z_002325 [Daucus carota]